MGNFLDKSQMTASLFIPIKDLIENAKKSIVRNINTAMLLTYLEIGKIIIENEQGGKYRAEYAKETLKNLSYQLTKEFGKGYSVGLTLSKDKEAIKQLAQKGQIIESLADVLKSHYILEFLDLKEDNRYSENDLETEIINKLEYFMLELGKGFLFEGRQRRFTFEGDSFFVDLVFYNRLLKCFVLLDLKIGKLTHQDIGQMQMYVNYYDRKKKLETENATIGIILCKEENKTVIEFTLPENNKTIFAKEYKAILPSKEELKRQIN